MASIKGGKIDASGEKINSIRVVTDADANAGLGDALDPFRIDPTGTTVQPVSWSAAQHVIVDSGGSGGGNAAASATGSAVPASADYTGFNSGGNLVGVSSANPLPISLASLPALAAGSAVIGHVINDASAAVIGHVIADTGSTTAVTGNVTAVQATGTNLHVVVDTAPTTAVTIATLPALTAGSAVIGHVIADTGSTTAVTGNVTAVQSVGTNLHVVADIANSTAVSCSNGNAAALSVLNIKASVGNVFGLTVVNKIASVIYLQFYNTAGTPVLGTGVVWWVPVAASATLVIPPGAFALGHFATGIGIGASTTPTSTGTPATAPDVSIFFL